MSHSHYTRTLKRKKQILLRETYQYLKESEIPIYYDPDPASEFGEDIELIRFPTDKEILANGLSAAALVTVNGHLSNHTTDNNQPPKLTQYGNGFLEVLRKPDSILDGDTDMSLKNTICELDFCHLGCICDSICKTDHEQYEKHCRDSGDPECIFGCICADDPTCANGKKWMELRDAANRYRQLRWWKDDDDCGFIAPGVKSLAHNEDGRPKRKSQPPERFRHGLNLDKIKLNKDFISSARSDYISNGNGHYSNGDRRISAPVTRQGSKSSTFNGGSSVRSSISTSTRSSSRSSSCGSNISSNASRKGSMSSLLASSRTISPIKRRFASAAAAAKLKLVSPPAEQTMKSFSSLTVKKEPHPQNVNDDVLLKNPCDKHSHDYGYSAICTGKRAKVISVGKDSDGLLINFEGKLIALIRWTTDGYVVPVIKRLGYRRHYRKIGKRTQAPSNFHANIESDNENTNATSTEVADIRKADLSTLLLPEHKDLKLNKAGENCYPNTPWRFYELPKNYQESNFVIYPELHAMFSAKALQASIKGSIARQMASSVPGNAANNDDIMTSSNDADKKVKQIGVLVNLNSINLNQPKDSNRKANVHLFVDGPDTLVFGTIPFAYRNFGKNAQQTSQKNSFPSSSKLRC